MYAALTPTIEADGKFSVAISEVKVPHGRRGEAAEVTSGVEEATGAAPRSFADFARDFARDFAKAFS